MPRLVGFDREMEVRLADERLGPPFGDHGQQPPGHGHLSGPGRDRHCPLDERRERRDQVGIVVKAEQLVGDDIEDPWIAQRSQHLP
jgi:hypothetical protein